MYVRSWGDQQRIFKIVSFYLLRYESGEIGDIAPDMEIEVKQALWIPLAGAERKITYRGERDVVKLAQKYLDSHNLGSQQEEKPRWRVHVPFIANNISLAETWFAT